MEDNRHELVGLAADIVAAYVSKNSIPAPELASLLNSVFDSVSRLRNGTAAESAGADPERPDPAVSIKKSVTPDFIICLEDGKKFKSLRRHLASAYQMTPDAYRTRWDLPRDYPMVAPNYAKTRSELAKKAGLGQRAKSATTKPTKPTKQKSAKAAAAAA